MFLFHQLWYVIDNFKSCFFNPVFSNIYTQKKKPKEKKPAFTITGKLAISKSSVE